MQDDTRKKLSADESSSHDRPHFMTTVVVHENTLCHGDESPWRREAPEHSGLHAPPFVGPHFLHTNERAPGMASEMLLNGHVSRDASTVLYKDSKPSEDRVDAKSATSELDTRLGGSIRDRIAALSAAAGVSRLNVTADREQSTVDVTPGREFSRLNVTREEEQSKMASEKGVAFDVEFQKPAKPRPPLCVVSRFRTKDLERECKTTFYESRILNIREPSAVTNGESKPVNSKEIKIIKNKELGVVKDKSLAFEVSFDDEPRSKRTKDEPVLLQSPFKAFKIRSNRRNQQKFNVKPLEPRRTKDGEKSLICAQNGYWKENSSRSTLCADSDAGSIEKAASDELFMSSSERDTQKETFADSEAPKLLKRNTFALESVSRHTANTSERTKVKALSELTNKDESRTDVSLGGQQRSSNCEEPKLQKRNTFTLDSVSQCTENAYEQGLVMARALNEVAGKEDSRASKPQDPPTAHFQKRNTYTLDSVSREGVPMVTLLKELDCDEERKLNNLELRNETPRKRGTFTLDSVSQSIQNASEEGVEVASVLDDLANKEEQKQRKQDSDVDTSTPSSETSQKRRGTFTLESVSREIDDAIEKYFPKEMAEKDSANDKKQESSEKPTTYTLDSVSFSLQSGADDSLPATEVLSQLAKQNELQSVLPVGSQESAQKRGTFTLDDVSHALEEAQNKGLPATEVLSQLSQQDELKSVLPLVSQNSVQKRGTFPLDDISQALEEAQNKGLPATEVLSQLSQQDESQSLSVPGVEESVQKRGTFTLDSVSQTLDEAQEKGLPTVEALHQLSAEDERHIPDAAPAEEDPPQKRGTYTLDTVSHAIEEAVEKGIPVSVTLNQLAHEGKAQQHPHAHDCSHATVDKVTCDPRTSGAFVQTSEHRDEIEASFEDALEQLEDCVTVDGEETFAWSSNRRRPLSKTPGNRGTYDLDDVTSSLQDGAKDGITVVETLDRLSRMSGIPKDGVQKSEPSEEKRGTYTLDEVSRSLEAASEKGIPVVEALQNLTTTKEANNESEDIEGGKGKRGTYTLNEVSKSLKHAELTGIPVIEALESLSKEKRKSPLRLKMPDRGTYTLDDISHTLEKAKQRGLPVVDALGHLTTSKDFLIRQTPDAVHRRQEKLVNRKTYALASPLETIGEGSKLRLYDGNQRQMMSPISFQLKAKEVTASKANAADNKARGLGVVQKLDFLTSACELLLEANAKELAKDQQRAESAKINPTSDEALRGSHRTVIERVSERPVDAEVKPKQSETDRNTYSLETVSLTIDDAKAKGIPVVESLKNVTTVVKTNTTQRTNRMRLNSKSDSELMSSGSEKERPERYTHSLENVSRTLEDAKKAGIPVIQALDQLTNDLAEFSLTAMSGSAPITQLGKDNRKRKRYSETAILRYQEQSPQSFPQGSPYPPPIRKAYSLGDVALAVTQAFQTGTSMADLLDDIAFEKPAEPVSSSKYVRPRSVDSGFVSSFSDNDISSQSFESPRNRSKSFIFDSSNEELDSTKIAASGLEATALNTKAISRSKNAIQGENRRTFTLDHMSDLSCGIPVIEAVEKLSNIELEAENSKQREYHENKGDVSRQSVLVGTSKPGRKKTPPKPKRQFSKKAKSPQSNSDSFVIEFFGSNSSESPITSKYQSINNKAEEVMDDIVSKKDIKDTDNYRKVSLDKSTVDTDLVPTRDPESLGLKSKAPLPISSSTPTRGRATWRSNGTVLDKIASLMDAAEDCGMSPADLLNQVTDLPCDAQGEIEESQVDENEESQAVTSQLAYLRMQLDEKRRHIEAEKHRAQAEWEDQRRRLGQTAFWYVIGKAQGGQAVGERPGSEVLPSDQGPVMQPYLQDKPGRPVAGFPDQPSPPIAWSSPANSPLPSVPHPASDTQQFETREFRLSDYPPGNEPSTYLDPTRPSSQPAVEVSSRPTSVPPRPSSHDPTAPRHTTPARKCWDVDVGQKATPPPLVRPDTASVNLDTKQETASPEGDGTPEIEVENHTPSKKGLAMFIGDDDNAGDQGLTPEQEKKREKFLRLRQKKQEEDRTRKEAELEKKRRRDEKLREKEGLRKMEEERLRLEEQERLRAEQELRLQEAQAARVPDSYATYRRAGPWQHAHDVSEDASSHIAPRYSQPSGFAEFSGPQCYVKPSGKSNRKIIVNAISHVCLSGTVNQDQKERCLQAISESDGHHFMILFKDGLKFRGIYVHNLENDQLFKVFGIGPRVVTSKMIEFLYKYNSGGKEFTKIPSKTISLSVDGLAIQKSCWNTGKPVVASKTSSNLKRPPRPPQR